jgi:hypothetical protein
VVATNAVGSSDPAYVTLPAGWSCTRRCGRHHTERSRAFTLLFFEITVSEDDCAGWHVGQLGAGLGTPGVSSTYSIGGDPCFGLEANAGLGPVTVSGEVGLDDDGTVGAGINPGVGVGVDDFVPVVPDAGLFVTFGCGWFMPRAADLIWGELMRWM